MLYRHERGADTLLACEEGPTRSDKEMNGGPNVWLERISETYHGITYEGRPLR
jgi:hypothetical protein